MEKISWTNPVRNEEVYCGVNEKRNILHTIKRRKVNRIDHILLRNCLITHIIEGKIEVGTKVKGRRERRRKQLLDDCKETRGYWILKAEASNRDLWGTRCRRNYGPDVGPTAE
jgi:hypothetical protein